MNSASVLVAILNWHSAPATLECLAAVARSRGVGVEVLVVDNGSTDGSAEELARVLGGGVEGLAGVIGEGASTLQGVHYLPLPRNNGYAGGMNAALEWAAGVGAEYVLLLTPDALVGPETIGRLTAALEADPGAGVAGPVVVYRAGPERLIGAGGSIDPGRVRADLYRTVGGDKPYPVDWIDGCCMLVRREAVAVVGGFDERYFLYFEETDLCARLGAAGWRILLVPDAEVLHEKVGAPASYYYYYMNRNRYHFWNKNFGVHPARVALAIAGETGGLAASWGLSLCLPSRRHRRADDRKRLALQLQAMIKGARDYRRGRLGPMQQ